MKYTRCGAPNGMNALPALLCNQTTQISKQTCNSFSNWPNYLPERLRMTFSPAYDPVNPLIVQSDRTLLVETQNERFEAARAAIAPFAELEKSPEYIHTY